MSDTIREIPKSHRATWVSFVQRVPCLFSKVSVRILADKSSRLKPQLTGEQTGRVENRRSGVSLPVARVAAFARTEQDPSGPRNSHHNTQSNHDWVGELFLFGTSQSCLSSFGTTCSSAAAPVALCQAQAAMAGDQTVSGSRPASEAWARPARCERSAFRGRPALPQSGLAWLRFLFPLIEPNRRVSRIRLSEKVSRGFPG